MCFGNSPLVSTLWLITVSAAMWPTIAFGKLPLALELLDVLHPVAVDRVEGRAWSSTMITTWEVGPARLRDGAAARQQHRASERE